MSETHSVHQFWGTPLNVFYCPHCQSAHVAPDKVPLTTCPACLQAAVSSQPESLRREPPELVIPFSVDNQQVSDSLTQWSKRLWFRPQDLRADLLLARVRPYYLTLWLVDTDVEATWQAEMGYDYQAASYRERYQGGTWRSEQTTETRIRWEPRVGRLKRHYDNLAVPALQEHDRWMTGLGGYDYRVRRPYTAQAIERSVVRIPDHDPDAAWPDAEYVIDRTTSTECKSASEADHIRNWSMRAKYYHLNWTQMLVPAYVTSYTEGDTTYPVWINGQSGKVYGIKHMSQHKAVVTSLVLGACAAFLFLVGMLLALIGAALVAPLVLGILSVAVGVLLGLLAPVPAIWVWLRNRRAGKP